MIKKRMVTVFILLLIGGLLWPTFQAADDHRIRSAMSGVAAGTVESAALTGNELLFDFESASPAGWQALGPNPIYNIGTSLISVDATLSFKGTQSLKIAYSGDINYQIAGPNPAALPLNHRYEYMFFIPHDSNVKGISLYTKDQTWKWDGVHVAAQNGLVKGKWFAIRQRTMTGGTTPFREYGIQVVAEDDQPGVVYVDAISRVADTVHKAVTPPYLRKGLNIDRPLDLPLVNWMSGEPITLYKEHFKMIRKAGFDFVRIPINPEPRTAAEVPYLIDDAYLKRMDWVLRTALGSGLAVVLDMHRYEKLMTDPVGEKARFLAMWSQLSARYAKFSQKLMFELLNEPNHLMPAEAWNQLLAETLQVIRVKNKSRYVIVGPVYWNAIDQLENLQLPAGDRRLIVTFHFYEPAPFTHQGASWIENADDWLGTGWSGTDIDKFRIADKLDKAVAWSRAHNRPLLLGEFGAYDKAVMDDRVRWTRFVREEVQKRNIPWAYWELWDGFGLFDRSTGMFRKPLLQSLLPASWKIKGQGFDRPLVISRNPTFGFEDASTEGWHGPGQSAGHTGTIKVTADTSRRANGRGSLKMIGSGKQEYVLFGFHPGRVQTGDTIDMKVWIPPQTNIHTLKIFSVDSGNRWHDRWFNYSNGLVEGKWVTLSYKVQVDGVGPFKNYGVQLLTADSGTTEVWLDSIRILSP